MKLMELGLRGYTRWQLTGQISGGYSYFRHEYPVIEESLSTLHDRPSVVAQRPILAYVLRETQRPSALIYALDLSGSDPIKVSVTFSRRRDRRFSPPSWSPNGLLADSTERQRLSVDGEGVRHW